MKITFEVEGMMCEHCKSAVENALNSVDGVDTVKVNLKKKTAVVKSKDDIASQSLIAAIESAGYKAKTV